MKVKKTIVMMAALAAVAGLASCTKDDAANGSGNKEVCFTGGIGNMAVATPQSRAAGAEWEKKDHIGIYMVKPVSTSILEGIENKDYVTNDGDGTFTPADGNPIYYPVSGKVEFIAYYPYREGYQLDTPIIYTIDDEQTTETQATFDLMWARAHNNDVGYDKNYIGGIPLHFNHLLSKLTMNCKIDASVGTVWPDDATVTLKGTNREVVLNLTRGTLVDKRNPGNITPRKLSSAPDGFLAAYDAIVMPESYDTGTVTVDFTVGGKTYTWKVGTVTFEPGKDHVYEVTLVHSGVQTTGKITDWDLKDCGGVEAD